ncbi:hypothetical protein [Salinispora cortesiana]|nr:hypothetical protein [Salinispora cortesiana]
MRRIEINKPDGGLPAERPAGIDTAPGRIETGFGRIDTAPWPEAA